MRMRALHQGLVLVVFGLLATANCGDSDDNWADFVEHTSCNVACGESCEYQTRTEGGTGYCDVHGHCGYPLPECPGRTKCGGEALVACPQGQYCLHDRGCRPSGDGYCAPVKTTCDPTACKGVCGCDGVQYCNECEANAHGVEANEYITECKPRAALCDEIATKIQAALALATACDACSASAVDQCGGLQMLDECGRFYVTGFGHDEDASAVPPLVQEYFDKACDVSGSHCGYSNKNDVKSTCSVGTGACAGRCSQGAAHAKN